MPDFDSEKRQAALAAADQLDDGMTLGLGSGSTVYFFLEELGRRVQAGLRIAGVPTSRATTELAKRFRIPLTTFADHPLLDVDVDGADEVDPDLNLIKGHGGALLREKIIARAARRRLIIVDDSKLASKLGAKAKLPVEVLPFGAVLAEQGLAELDGRPQLRRTTAGEPFVTDNGNWIVDCRFDSISDVGRLEAAINAIPGVLENGLFVNLADEVLVAGGGGVQRLVRPAQSRA